MNRRNFLTGSATIPVLAAGAAVGAAVSDPHPEWLERWQEARARWIEAVENSVEEKELSAEKDRLSDMIMGCDAQTPKGLLAQVEYMRGQIYDGMYIETEDNPVLLRILSSAQNLAA